MCLLQRLLWIPWVVAAGVLVWFLPPRFPRIAPPGWKRWLIRLDLAVLLLPALWYGWHWSCAQITEGSYRCMTCGRRERQTDWRGWRAFTEVCESGDEYLRRFAAIIPSEHSHDWVAAGCMFTRTGVGCHSDIGLGWFDCLPSLRDRNAADAIVRESNALAEGPRRALMTEFTRRVRWWPDPTLTRDEAFEAWIATRGTD
jgi:hypothetical protein